jgi:hypothetical protein
VTAAAGSADDSTATIVRASRTQQRSGLRRHTSSTETDSIDFRSDFSSRFCSTSGLNLLQGQSQAQFSALRTKASCFGWRNGKMQRLPSRELHDFAVAVFGQLHQAAGRTHKQNEDIGRARSDGTFRQRPCKRLGGTGSPPRGCTASLRGRAE